MATSASKEAFTDDESRCLRALHRHPIYDGTVRLILSRIEHPEAMLRGLRSRGLVTKPGRAWTLTAAGEAVAAELVKELERQKPKRVEQVGYVGYGQRLHLLRVSTRTDRGERGPYYAVCGSDTFKSKCHPVQQVKEDRPLTEQINCPRCIKTLDAEARRKS